MNRNNPLYISIIFYIISLSIILLVSLKLNDGVFGYALDDAYIHMSMADNFVKSGNWATNHLEFTSASSSPLWVLMISSVYALIGKNMLTPFFLNLLFQLITVAVAYSILRKYLTGKMLALCLAALIFITPFPALLFAGMEHSAQIMLAVLFVFSSLILIESDKIEKGRFSSLLIITILFAAIRYEDVIIIAVISILFYLKGKKLLAFSVFTAALLPILVYGFISLSNGWYFLPNTLLLKGSMPGFSAVGIARFFFRAFSNITEPHIFILLIIIALLYVFNLKKQKSFWSMEQLLLFVTGAGIIINMSIIDYNHNGAFYRYEAYLMALGVLAVIININKAMPDIEAFLKSFNGKKTKYIIFVFTIVIISPLLLRVFTLFGIPQASFEYHTQQYQMAQFCKLYANDKTVAFNDIGMINYYSDCRVFDLLGLANIDIARLRLNKHLTTQAIDSLSKKEDVRLVICYQSWFDEYGGLPAGWKKIAEWTMNGHGFFLGNSTVDIFVANAEDESYFREKLVEFAPELPRSVTCKIY